VGGTVSAQELQNAVGTTQDTTGYYQGTTTVPNIGWGGIQPQYPNTCPGCGRCKDCGRPWETQPYNPYPYQPLPYPYQPWDKYPWTITCGQSDIMMASGGLQSWN
jgi:hypothetical protein